MAPEISRGNYGKEIDIYALGVILFEMLSGKVPFEGQSVQEIVVKHMTAAPDLTGFASPYKEVIAKALAKDPSQRYADVSGMVSELGLASHTSKVFTTPPRQVQIDAPKSYETTQNAYPFKNATPPPLPEAFNPMRASAAIDEPIAAAVLKTLSDAVYWWKSLKNPIAQMAVLAGVSLLMFRTAGFWGGIAYWQQLSIQSITALDILRHQSLPTKHLPLYPITD